MTAYLLKDHQFRSLPSWRQRNPLVRSRATDGQRQLQVWCSPGPKQIQFRYATDINLASVENKFRTILGDGGCKPSWHYVTSFMSISFKCSDATGNKETALPATVTLRAWGAGLEKLLAQPKMSAQLSSNGNMYFFEQTVAVDHPTTFPKVINYQWEGKITAILIAGTKGGGASLRDLVPTGNPINKKLMEERLYSDFILVAQNRVAFPTHKMFLAVHSPVLHDLLLSTDWRQRIKSPYHLNNSEEAVRAFLKFIYYFDIDDPLGNPNVALELLELGRKFEIPDLENVIQAMFLSVECLKVDVALDLFRLSGRNVYGYQALREKAVNSLKMRKEDFKESTGFEKLTKSDPASATELASLVFA
ncbi:Protein maternal effect lethal 26 [Orchesella cincta]|uniref:Protein maternal effect lethal 26 n=1 Tax=Orchesella cincta TaxID=48709 RepID=A0A1D2MKR8_ORCCI|nr:Protein maternal effect lethal 26 [Orchesella cincta]